MVASRARFSRPSFHQSIERADSVELFRIVLYQVPERIELPLRFRQMLIGPPELGGILCDAIRLVSRPGIGE